MKLDTKKRLAAKTMSVGVGRIMFNNHRIDEIKEAITRQDIRDLVANRAIIIKENKGRKKIVKRKSRRGHGKVKNKVNNRKREYVLMVRKLRSYLNELKKQGKINSAEYIDLRKKIRNKIFKNKRHLKTSVNVGEVFKPQES